MKNFGGPTRGIGRILVLTLAVLGWQLMCSPAHAQLAADEAVFTDYWGETIGVVSATDLEVKWRIDLNDERPVDIGAILPEAVDVTSDGTRAVIGSWGRVSNQWVNRIELVDLTDPQVLYSIDPGVISIQELDIAPDDSFGIVSGSIDGRVSKFTLDPFNITGTAEPWAPGNAFGGAPQDVHINTDGTVAVQPMFYADFLVSVDITGDVPQVITRIETPNWSEYPTYPVGHHGISLSEWDNDTIIATAAFLFRHIDIPYVTVTSLSNPSDITILDAPGQPESVDITCDGTRAVVETSGGLMWINMEASPPVVLYDSFDPDRPARNDHQSTSTVAFSADGKLLFVGGGEQIDVYDATTDPPQWKGSIQMEEADINNIATLPCSAAVSKSKIEVAVDIKPRSCPNPLNVKSKGVLPVAILGTVDFDVMDIDPRTIRFDVDGDGEGVRPLRWNLTDVATPFDVDTRQGDCFDCTKKGPDGFTDLTLKFKTNHIVTAIGSVSNGDSLVLTFTGELFDGTPIVGDDVVRIIKKKKYSKKWMKKWLFNLLKEIKKEKKAKIGYIEKKTKPVISKAKPKWHRKYKRH